MDFDQHKVEVENLVAELFELSGALRRDGEASARAVGQTVARWQVLWIAATGRLSVAAIARRLGLARQSVQRVADVVVAEGLASFEPNPDHRRSPLLVLTDTGQAALEAMNESGSRRVEQVVDALGEDGIKQLRGLLARYGEVLREPVPPPRRAKGAGAKRKTAASAP